MGDRIKEYVAYIDDLLASEDDSIDWEEEIKKHLIQIKFFAHERLIHLIVTVLFAMMTVLVFLYLLSDFNLSIFALLVAIMILLIPYIKHYFLMENSVQYMFEQYDKMMEKAGKRAFKRKGEFNELTRRTKNQ
ncbi:MAG: hypothetical protein ACI4GW_01285 [Lachnospiraceae bacterium]